MFRNYRCVQYVLTIPELDFGKSELFEVTSDGDIDEEDMCMLQLMFLDSIHLLPSVC